jgi:signal transduction histidine kinase
LRFEHSSTSLLPRVFAPFTQLDGGATRAKGGMGLGLSIAQRMAQAMGGDITAISEFGSGSTFTLRTPVPTAPPIAAREAA